MLTLELMVGAKENLGIVTNMGFSIHPIGEDDIKRTDGLVYNAVGQIVVRELRVVRRGPDGRKDFQEFTERIYVWADGQTTHTDYTEIPVWIAQLQQAGTSVLPPVAVTMT